MAEIYPQGMAIPTADVQRLLQQSFAEQPIQVNPDILAQYNPNATQLQVQAPAPPPQVIQQYQGLQPSRDRQQYFNLVQQRFNELADMVGGMDVLAKTKHIETARKAAMEDVANIYGPPPDIEKPQRPLQVQQIPGTEKVMVYGAGMQAPQFIEATKPQTPAQMQPIFDAQGQIIPGIGMVNGEIKTFEPPQMAQEAKAKAASQNLNMVSKIVSSVDKLLADENALKWAGGKTGAVLKEFPGETRGIRQKIEQLRAQIGLFGREAIVGKGQGTVSDTEQKMAQEALAQIITEGTDEQLISSLKALRQDFSPIFSRLQAEASGRQDGASVPQPIQEGVTKRTYVSGKGFIK